MKFTKVAHREKSSPSHSGLKGEGEVVLIEAPLSCICFTLPIWICLPLPTQQILPHSVHFRSVEWQWLDHGNAISMLVCDLNNEVGQKTRQLTWHWWCWLEAAKWLKWWKLPLQGLIQQLSTRCPPMLKTPLQIMIESQFNYTCAVNNLWRWLLLVQSWDFRSRRASGVEIMQQAALVRSQSIKNWQLASYNDWMGWRAYMPDLYRRSIIQIRKETETETSHATQNFKPSNASGDERKILPFPWH